MSDSEKSKPVSDEDADLFFRLFNEIGIIDQLASSAFERALPHGLTLAQFTVLNHCVRLGDNRTPAQLARAFQLTRGTLTSTLGRLEAKGFIRIEADQKDGRSKRVFLTREGRAAREGAIRAARPHLDRVAGAFVRDDVHAIMPALQKLRAWLDQNRDM
ncbi:MAG: MarR family transcriptional regulator [Alphaproteobacteria bacterium]|nr:MarR family transcriptional regulator [Alphaproteobacteria bacterium]